MDFENVNHKINLKYNLLIYNTMAYDTNNCIILKKMLENATKNVYASTGTDLIIKKSQITNLIKITEFGQDKVDIETFF